MVSEPTNSGETLPFLGLWDMGRECYRIPVRAQNLEEGLPSGVLVNILQPAIWKKYKNSDFWGINTLTMIIFKLLM